MEIPLQKIPARSADGPDSSLEKSEINLYMLRLDLIHPGISGNKRFKLKYNLQEAKRQKKDTLVTFGGAFSNHIAATAEAGKELGFKTIGIIRGDELSENKNLTLRFAKECGMRLHFVSREEYKRKDPSTAFRMTDAYNYYILPEGGTNELAVKGCSEILSQVKIPFDYVCCPVGTGGTIAGIISSLKKNQKAIGFSVLKAGGFLKSEVAKLLSSSFPLFGGHINVNTDYHFGGYAKYTPELLKFISDFESRTKIPLEHVYTGKMMFGIYDLIKENYFSPGSTIIAIHTDGMRVKLPYS